MRDTIGQFKYNVTTEISRLKLCKSDRDSLIINHIPLVIKLASVYGKRKHNTEELIGVGCLRLLEVVDKYFDKKRGNLTTLLYRAIPQSFRQHARENEYLVKFPRRTWKQMGKIRVFCNEHGGNFPSKTEMKSLLGYQRFSQKRYGELFCAWTCLNKEAVE